VLHGLSGAQKKAARAVQQQEVGRLEGHRLNAPKLQKILEPQKLSEPLKAVDEA
jgi:hypothetical protein